METEVKASASVSVASRVTPKEKEAIQLLVRDAEYINESDFIRTAIREKLKKGVS